MAVTTKLHFARFEFKYILTQALRDDLERELRYFLEFDSFVAATPGHQYFVRSLYFDDPFFTAYYDKSDGVHTRAKFRIRTYTDDPKESAPQFLEIKGRYNNLVLKHRVMLDQDKCIVHDHGEALTKLVLESVSATPVGQQFAYEIFRKRIRPVALVDYSRRPYISRFDPDFRLTFDSNLYATQTSSVFPVGCERRRMMLPGYTIMEVKFKHHIPSWFHRLIQSYELQRVSVSKICRAMETLEIVEGVS